MPFYKTTIKVEVLSRSKYNPESLEGVAYDIVDGGCSGTWDVIKVEKLTKKQCIEELEKQGSDPSFIECMD